MMIYSFAYVIERVECKNPKFFIAYLFRFRELYLSNVPVDPDFGETCC